MFLTPVLVVLSLTIIAQTKINPIRNDLELENRALVVGDQSQTPNIPSDIITLNNAAVAKGMKGNYEEAIIDFRRAYDAAPQCMQCGYNLAAALFRTRRFDESRRIYTDLIRIKADYGQAYSGLGDALYAEGNYDESIAAYRRALQLMPNDAATLNNLGITLNAAGDYKRAFENLEKAAKIEPNLKGVLSNLGAVLYRLGRYREAVEVLRRAVAVDPASAEAHNNLGVALCRIGKHKEEHKHYLEAVRLRPDYAEGLYNLAVNYLERGERDEARSRLAALERLDTELSALFKKHYFQPFVLNAAEEVERKTAKRKP